MYKRFTGPVRAHTDDDVLVVVYVYHNLTADVIKWIRIKRVDESNSSMTLNYFSKFHRNAVSGNNII